MPHKQPIKGYCLSEQFRNEELIFFSVLKSKTSVGSLLPNRLAVKVVKCTNKLLIATGKLVANIVAESKALLFVDARKTYWIYLFISKPQGEQRIKSIKENHFLYLLTTCSLASSHVTPTPLPRTFPPIST